MLLNRRNQAKEPYSEDPDAPYWGGSVSSVRICDVEAADAELPAILTGYADATKAGIPVRKAISDIEIRNYRVTCRDNQNILHIPAVFDEFLTEYPESNAHGDVDACGLWIRHADHVLLENVQITPRSSDSRERIRMYDVKP